jgi:membrane protein
MRAPPTVCVRQGMGKASDMGTTRGSGATGAESSNAARGDEEAEAAEKPGLLSALKLAFTNFRTHNMTDRGASLTYYLVMSLFPALLVAVSLLGFFGQQSIVADATKYLEDAGAPESVTGIVKSSLESIVNSSSGKALLPLIIGIALGLNSASGAYGAAGRALNVAYGEPEDRGLIKKKGTQIFFTLVVIVLALITLASVFIGGGLAVDLFGTIGLGETVGEVWRYARWAVALVSTMLIFGIIYAFAPDLPEEKFRFISPGAAFAVILWIIASVAFFLYVSNFSNYNATYGAFAGAIIFLLWLYITSLAFLLGGELNAVYERQERGKPKTATVEAGEEA